MLRNVAEIDAIRSGLQRNQAVGQPLEHMDVGRKFPNRLELSPTPVQFLVAAADSNMEFFYHGIHRREERIPLRVRIPLAEHFGSSDLLDQLIHRVEVDILDVPYFLTAEHIPDFLCLLVFIQLRQSLEQCQLFLLEQLPTDVFRIHDCQGAGWVIVVQKFLNPLITAVERVLRCEQIEPGLLWVELGVLGPPLQNFKCCHRCSPFSAGFARYSSHPMASLVSDN